MHVAGSTPRRRGHVWPDAGPPRILRSALEIRVPAGTCGCGGGTRKCGLRSPRSPDMGVIAYCNYPTSRSAVFSAPLVGRIKTNGLVICPWMNDGMERKESHGS